MNEQTVPESSAEYAPNETNILRVAFLGCVVPEADSESYSALSWAGNLFQLRLIESLRANGLPLNAVFSGRPVASFPRTHRLWFAGNRTELIPGVQVDHIPFINFGFLKTVSLGFSVVVSLIRWGWRYRRSGRNILVTYNVHSPHGIAIIFGARLIGAKVVTLIADVMLPGHGTSSSLFRRVDFLLQRWSLRHVDGLIALTPNTVPDFAPKVQSIVMEGALPEEIAHRLASLPEPQESITGIHTILYAGQLDSLRGTDLLLQAFSILNGDRYRLVVIGKGPMAGLVEEAAHSDKRIDYLGYLPSYEDVLSRYTEASTLVNLYMSKSMSTKYLFPSKLIEYIATGRPVISSMSPGVNEEYGDFIYPLCEETPRELANLIQTVAATCLNERSARAELARNFITQHKTWTRQGKRLAEFLSYISANMF